MLLPPRWIQFGLPLVPCKTGSNVGGKRSKAKELQRRGLSPLGYFFQPRVAPNLLKFSPGRLESQLAYSQAVLTTQVVQAVAINPQQSRCVCFYLFGLFQSSLNPATLNGLHFLGKIDPPRR
jgi:hypothetical protein